MIAPLTASTRERLKGRVPKHILAVRGKRTRHELITQLGWEVPEVYGDPALLLERLYAPSTESAVDAAYTVCPHYLHMKDIAGRADLRGHARLVDVQRDAETVVTELANSRAVISTSLHGLIVAQAYGVPWVWLRIADKQLAGDAFKFEDFFTTLDRDNVAATTLTVEELKSADFAAIAKKARVPRSNFDAAALIDAFPYSVLGPLQSRSAADVGVVLRAPSPASSEDSRSAASPDFRLPVVLISFNRGSMLRRVVDGYRSQSIPVDIFIHDNGSDDPETCGILTQLENEGVVVFRRSKISSPKELNLVDESVQRIFQTRPASPYAVSDCDVSIAESSPATLQVYLDVLQAMPDVECVGPMLRIDDVPSSYPLYNAMLNRHIRRFWSKEPQWALVGGAGSRSSVLPSTPPLQCTEQVNPSDGSGRVSGCTTRSTHGTWTGIPTSMLRRIGPVLMARRSATGPIRPANARIAMYGYSRQNTARSWKARTGRLSL
ncbi:polysaccharide pyruvyl transferase family protein [Marilutibacter alkalisoli]|uniref:polysaccharide pyruvyl transferase family protein n=1 Tax=Marilutibacter alkalisoli TaxID=2591633 RepID=UPI00387ED2FA